MLVFSCDTGGPASRHGLRLLQRILDRPALHLSARGDIARIRSARGSGDALVVLEAPEAAIVSAANRSGWPILRFEDGLEACVRDLMAVHRVGFVDALRHATKLRATAEALQTISVEADEAAIRTALGLPGAPPMPVGDAVAPSQPVHAFDCDARTILDAVGASPPVWPPAVFLRGDAPGEPVQSAIGLVGPARLLAYGPYLHLGSGRWRLVARATIAENFSGNRLAIEMLADGTPLGKTSIVLPADEAVELVLSFEVVEPRHGLELYWRLEEGAIEGTLALSCVRLTRERP